jgi:hypothetical protein
MAIAPFEVVVIAAAEDRSHAGGIGQEPSDHGTSLLDEIHDPKRYLQREPVPVFRDANFAETGMTGVSLHNLAPRWSEARGAERREHCNDRVESRPHHGCAVSGVILSSPPLKTKAIRGAFARSA